MRSKLIFAGTIFFLGPAVYAQHTPVIAHIQETDEVFVNGTKTESHVRMGNYYRKSDGSVLEEWLTIDGDPAKARGTLTDNQNNAVYSLNYSNHNAFKRTVHPPSGSMRPSGPPQVTEPNSSFPRKVVGGILCAVIPIRPSPGQPVEVSGEICKAAQYNLDLIRDMTQTEKTQAGLTVYHSNYEMSGVQLNIEPDPKFFDLQGRGFSVVAIEPPHSGNH